MAQAQVTINGLTGAASLSLQDEIELDQFDVNTSKRLSRKATLQAVASLFSGGASPIVKIDVSDSPYAATILLPTILVDTSGGAVVIQLPAITVLTPRMLIKNLPTETVNQILVTPAGGDTVELDPNFYLAFEGQSIELLPYVPDNNWNVF